jgi:hypothetical protein
VREGPRHAISGRMPILGARKPNPGADAYSWLSPMREPVELEETEHARAQGVKVDRVGEDDRGADAWCWAKGEGEGSWKGRGKQRAQGRWD